MILLKLLSKSASRLRINDKPPAFVYDSQGMDNYEMDNVPHWSVNVPVLEETFTFDQFQVINYNIPVSMYIVSELNREAEYYADIFSKLLSARDRFLKEMDSHRDTEVRRLCIVSGEIAIRTTFIAQSMNFDTPATAIIFNLPVIITKFQPLC